MRNKSTELREQRLKLVSEIRDLDASASKEDRDLTSDEVEKFDKIDTEIRSVEEKIERAEKLEGFDAEARSLDNDEEFRAIGSGETATIGIDSDEYRDAFSAYLRGGEVRTTMNVGTDGQGGYTVAEQWGNQLLESLREQSVIRGLAQVYTTGSGGDLHLPTVATYGSADQTNELGNYNVSEPTVSEVIMKAYKMTQMVFASEELLQDSIFDIDSFVRNIAAQNLAIKEGALFSNGGGTTGPQGLFVGASVGATASSKTAVTADELMDLFHSVTSPYRTNASWVLNDSTIRDIRKLKDSVNGQYLWQPGLQAGTPDTLLGRPVYAEMNAPTMAASNKAIAFGNIKAGYALRDVGTAQVKFRDQQFGANDDGKVAWAIRRRTDGRIVDAAALKALKMGS